MLLILLTMLKLGIYAPSQDAPMGLWFYGGANILGPSTPDKLGIEVGWTKEPRSEYFQFNSTLVGRRILYKDAVLAGISYNFNKDFDVVGGARHVSNQWFPYISMTLKVNTLLN